MPLRVLVNGAFGRMGQETVQAIENDAAFQLVGKTGRGDDLCAVIKTSQAQVVVDFTPANAVYQNAKRIIQSGVHPVIGGTGLTADQVKELQQLAASKKLGGIIAPNFSIGAVLMMRCAQQCAAYFPQIEIIELHHDQKVDAPSGTALKTAEMVASGRRKNPETKQSKELVSGARGAVYQDVHIHSVRLPGFVAHQEVIFGNQGETLTIRHDSIHRQSFMPGVLLACKKVVELDGLVYGLDQLI